MTFKNPVIGGFNPDPSICRVGDDYYLVTSTFEYFPGIPIYHSRDLVNWEHIANAITRQSQLPMETAKPSAGIWAPTIRYDNGRFYITATFSEKGNFIVSAEDPCGEWSDPVWTEMDGIDPSMMFDSGKMYYCANDCGSRGRLYKTEGISVAEMDPNTGKVIGEIKRVWDGTGGGWIEAPHIYHIGEWYYILAAEGGTNMCHMEIAARSRSIWGPYENCPYNPILTNRNDTTKQASCCGHADFIEDANGSGWLVHLATRPYVSGKTPLGRETFLTPVEWKDGWPLAVNKKARIENEINAVQQKTGVREFGFQTQEWEPEWISVRGRREENVLRGDGKLILRPSQNKLNDMQGIPIFMAIRQPDFECTIEAELDFTPQEDGDEVGVAAYLTPCNNYRICKKRENDRNYIAVIKRADDFIQEAYCAEVPDGRLKLKIISHEGKYEFMYSVNNGEFISAATASAKFLTTDVAERCFTGTVIGVYAESDKDTPAEAVVYSYMVK
ncbi:MAG: glycoside hydrolase family 43 protein [Oscillospiraceae bacterium]|nr:glycoside hydrolase family 43 protein [Oscillospiraceae bacterium]